MARHKQGMTATQVRAIVEAHIDEMKRLLGVADWKIRVDFVDHSAENLCGTCARQLPYQFAVITIDPVAHLSQRDVLDTLRHELIHVVLAPFDSYRAMAIANIKPDSPMDKVEDKAWKLSVESSVLAIERIFDRGLTNYPITQLCKPEPTKRARKRGNSAPEDSAA
jgi:hypothetical protein